MDDKETIISYICLQSPDIHVSATEPQAFEWVDRLLLLFDRAQSGLENQGKHEILRDEYRRILIASIPKTMDALVSTAKLCDAGLTEDARTISRKVLEIAVTLVYMNTDLAEREGKAQRFYYHGFIEDSQNLYFVEKYPHMFSGFMREGLAELRQETLSKYELAKQYYPCDSDGSIRPKYRTHWDGKSLNELISLSHMRRALVPYKVFCSSTHFSSSDVIVYIDLEKSVIRPGQFPEEVPHLLHESIALAGQILQLVDGEFGLDVEDDLQQLAYEMSRSGDDS